MRGYVSPGLAAAEGFESGVNLGIKVRRAERDDKDYEQQQRDKAEDRAWTRSERERLTRSHARAEEKDVEDREYTQSKRELEAVELERAQLNTQLTSIAQRKGGFNKDDPEQAALTGRMQQVNQRRRQALERLVRPQQQRYEKQAREAMGRLQSDPASIANWSDEDAYRIFFTTLNRPPEDFFRGPNNEPSKIGGAIQRIEQGFGAQDQQSIVDGASIILEPELSVGIGADVPEGGTIVSKQLDRFVPSQDRQGYHINLKVGVQQPDGSVKLVDRPVTEGRSSDNKARVVTVDPAKMMERLGRIGMMEELLNHPEVRAKVERGAAKAAQEMSDFWKQLSELGAPPGKFTQKDRALGDRIETQTINEAGQPVGKPTERRMGINPTATARAAASGSGTEIKVTQVDEVDPETGETKTRLQYERIPKAGPPGPIKTEGTPPPTRGSEEKPSEVRTAAENERARAAGKMGLSWDDGRKQWMAGNKPATQDQVRLLNEVYAAALDLGKKSKGAADSVPKPKLPDSEVARLRKVAEQYLKDKKKNPDDVRRVFKEQTGLDL